MYLCNLTQLVIGDEPYSVLNSSKSEPSTMIGYHPDEGRVGYTDLWA